LLQAAVFADKSMKTNLVGKPVQQPFYETFFSQKSTPHPALRPRQMGVLFLTGKLQFSVALNRANKVPESD
jgi:hypothetical protein